MAELHRANCHSDLTTGRYSNSMTGRKTNHHNLPFEGCPRAVHVLFPVSTPVSPSALAFNQTNIISEISGLAGKVFSQVCCLSNLYLVDVVKQQKPK